jgi:hypothetical protein
MIDNLIVWDERLARLPEPVAPDLSEAVEAFRSVGNWCCADSQLIKSLIAAYPALHAAMSQPVDDAPAVRVPWPDWDDLEVMIGESNHGDSFVAMQRFARRLKEWQDEQVAERKRAGGGK